MQIGRVDEKGNPLEPITLEEWKAVVAATENVRPAAGDLTAVNPATGEVIRLPSADGDAEIFHPAEARWIPVFRWSRGKIRFKAPADWSAPGGAIEQAARLLAKTLRARITGEEGEFYD